MMEPWKTFQPLKISEVEISQPLPGLMVRDQPGDFSYTRALSLIRLHTLPVGVLELNFDENGLSADQYAGYIWRELGDEINAHLLRDGLSPVQVLDAGGLPNASQPACLEERARVLADPPFVSVLVATRNRPETLAICLDSLLALEYPNFDVIVIDNAPANDETDQFVKKRFAASPKVRYVREDRPGLAMAHNCGLAQTSAPIIAITDDDVRVDRYWLTELVKGFLTAPKAGCVTGMIFPSEIQTQAQYWIERAAGYAKGFTRRVYDLADHRPNQPLFPYAAGMFGSGANMAFRAETLREMGGFDSALGAGSVAMGGDDLASFYEVIASGWTLVYEPAAIIYHRHYREYERLRKTAYGYGAGLTAYLTKVLLDHPGRIFDMARRAPVGLYYALGRGSAKNARKAEDYPAELTWIERKGMLAGPLLYLRSRWKTRKTNAPPTFHRAAVKRKDQIEQ